VSTFTVNNTIALNAALKTAHAGDTIQLGAGSYSGVVINNFNVGGGITITSKDPKHVAVLTDLKVTGSSGLNFTNLEFSFAAAADEKGTNALGIKVESSSDIHFRSDSIHGTLDHNPLNDVVGLSFKQVSNVSVENSEFQQLRVAITEGKSTGVTITGNNFHDIRVDGVDNTASTNVVISGNNFSNFHHTAGDHSDAIQFFTYGQTVGSSNITIADNVIVQGQGEVMQGIFLQDEVGSLPFKNVTIQNNMIVGGNWNGLMVKNAQNVTVTGNTLAKLSTDAQTPWIKLVDVDSATVTGNAASSAVGLKNVTHVTQASNNLNAVSSDNGVSALNTWFGQHSHLMTTGPKTVAQLTGGSVGVAAPLTAPDDDSSDSSLVGILDDTSASSSASAPVTQPLSVTPSPASSPPASSTPAPVIQPTSGVTTPTASAPAPSPSPSPAADNDFNMTGKLLGGKLNTNNVVTGTEANDRIVGGSRGDYFEGGKGDDLMSGGGGNDTYVFKKGSGHDTVTDFADHDLLDISNYLYHNNNLKPIITDASDGLTISFTTGDSIKLLGVHPAELVTTGLGFSHV
jgi:hypothetical protein